MVVFGLDYHIHIHDKIIDLKAYNFLHYQWRIMLKSLQSIVWIKYFKANKAKYGRTLPIIYDDIFI